MLFRSGVQGGTSPYIVDKHFDEVNVDPYGIESPEYQTTEAFNDTATTEIYTLSLHDALPI